MQVLSYVCSFKRLTSFLDMLSLVSATKSSTHDRVLFGRFLDNCYWILIIIIKVRCGSHLGKTKNTENLKPQLESKLFLSTIRVALGEKNISVMTLCIT